MRKRWLPDNVTTYKDRHGKARYRYRKAGTPTYTFRHNPGTVEFLAELEQAKSATPAPKGPRFKPGTYDDLIQSFYQSPRWVGMKDSSQNTYRGIIERFRAKNGDKPVRGVTAGSIETLLGRMAATPSAANNLRKTLSRLHRHAIKLGWRTDNPVEATDPYKVVNEGHHTWTEAEIAQFEARWPVGTREHLAMSLLLNTALRRSDMVRLGKNNRVGDTLALFHGKNSSETVIRIMDELRADLDAIDTDAPFWLVTHFGEPFTGNGFGNWFRERCDLAGLPQCSAHGLRKAVSRRLAESGATNQQGKAVTGHKTDKEFTRYAEKANRTDMADTALANLEVKFAKRKIKDA